MGASVTRKGNEGRSGPNSGQATPNEVVEPVQVSARQQRGASNAATAYISPAPYTNGYTPVTSGVSGLTGTRTTGGFPSSTN